jgi:CDP-diacylglycerol--glycerol-3-phosphate 3-phosphatidyltransferase
MIGRLVLARVSPDAITVAAFGFALGSALFIGMGRLLVGCLLLLVGGVLDFMDGKVAALTGRATVAGAILDSTLDRYSDAAVYLGLMIFFAVGGHGATAVAAVVALAGSGVTSYVMAQAEVHGYSLRAGLLRRQDRVVLLAAGLLLSPLHAPFVEWLRSTGVEGAVALPNLPVAAAVWLLAVLTNVSAVQRLTVLRGLARGKTVGAPGEMPSAPGEMPSAPGETPGAPGEMPGPRGQGLRDRQLRTLRAVLEQPDSPEEGRQDES